MIAATNDLAEADRTFQQRTHDIRDLHAVESLGAESQDDAMLLPLHPWSKLALWSSGSQ